MRLSDLLAPERVSADVDITGLTADSRRVRPGFLFAALKGVKADGARFIPDAIAAGAAAVLAEPGAAAFPALGAILIEDPNPRRRLSALAGRFFARQPETVVGVTGTNGKSSTVDFLRQIWTADGRRAASLGTLGVAADGAIRALDHTTPDPVAIHETLDALAGDGVTCAALEASSHGLVQHRLDAVRFAAVGFTNLTQDHLDYHATLDDYFAAKARLFAELAPQGAPAVINVDSDFGRRLAAIADEAGLDVRRVGWSGAAIKVMEIAPKPTSQRLTLLISGRERVLDLPLAGEFQALNAIGAAGLALATGVEEARVFEALAALGGVRGRLEFVGETAAGAAVFVDYAHTPDGLEKLLRAVRPHTRGRVVLVFGAGGDRDPWKRPKMGEVAARLADVVYVTDDNPRTENPGAIRAAILRTAPSSREIADRADAIATAIGALCAGDTLVIAGKGHETFQIIGETAHPFDDRDAARAALGQTSAAT